MCLRWHGGGRDNANAVGHSALLNSKSSLCLKLIADQYYKTSGNRDLLISLAGGWEAENAILRSARWLRSH